MTRSICFAFAFCFALVLSTATAAQSDAEFSLLAAKHAEIVEKWLKTNSQWRIATDKDYDRANLKYARQEKGKSFQPFYVAGDFNRDGSEDFAVIVRRKNRKNRFAAVVFNAPFGKNGKHTFFYDVLQADDMVIYNRENKTLYLAPFASDNG